MEKKNISPMDIFEVGVGLFAVREYTKKGFSGAMKVIIAGAIIGLFLCDR